MHELLVHEDGMAAALIVARVEQPSGAQPQTEGLGVPGGHFVRIAAHARRLAAPRFGRQIERRDERRIAEGYHVAGPGRHDAGIGAQALEEHRRQFPDALWRRAGGRKHLRDEHVARRVARIDTHQRREASSEQRGPDDEQRRGGSFGDEQHVAHPARACAAETASDRAVAAVERGRQVERRSADRGEQACEDRRGNRDECGEDADARVEPHISQSWKVRRRQRRRRAHHRPGERSAHHRATGGEQEALGEQLATEAAASRAERGAQRELALARDTAREKQVGDVRARDEKDEDHARAEHHQHRTDRRRHLLHQSDDVDLYRSTDAIEDVEHLRTRHAARDGGAFCRRLSGRDARLQPSQREREPHASLDRWIEPRRIVVRRPQLRLVIGKVEVGPGDANDRVRLPFHDECPADDEGRAAQAFAPEAIADDDEEVGAGSVLASTEEAAELRRRAQQWKERRPDLAAVEAHGAVRKRHRVFDRVVRRDVFERAQPRRPRVQCGAARLRLAGRFRRARMLFVDTHQAVGLGIRQRPEQDAVDDREDRGRCADTEREREERGGGERPIAPEHDHGVLQILERIHSRSVPIRWSRARGM